MSPMASATELFRWWVIDESTGESRLTTYKLSRADAARAFPGAEPDPETRELREIRDPHAVPLNSRPGKTWSSS